MSKIIFQLNYIPFFRIKKKTTLGFQHLQLYSLVCHKLILWSGGDVRAVTFISLFIGYVLVFGSCTCTNNQLIKYPIKVVASV